MAKEEAVSQAVQVVTYEGEEGRLLGLYCNVNEMSVHFLNVYLTTESSSNHDENMCYIGKISSSIIHDMFVAVVHHSDNNTYTHVNNNRVATSWLDYVVVTNNISHAFCDCQVL